MTKVEREVVFNSENGQKEMTGVRHSDDEVKNILVLQNAFEKTRKQMKANTLSINVLSDYLNFPMFAELTLKKT